MQRHETQVREMKPQDSFREVVSWSTKQRGGKERSLTDTGRSQMAQGLAIAKRTKMRDVKEGAFKRVYIILLALQVIKT